MATYHELKREAKRLNCTLEVDDDCQCYRMTAAEGQRFDPDLHELIAVFGDGFIGNGQTKAEARTDLYYQTRGYIATEACNDPKCSWCNNTN